MTLKREIEVDCPNCGASNLIVVWKTINVQISPEGKAALLRGQINVFRCGVCDETLNVDASLVYNDMENKFMVWYFPFADVMNGGIFDAITPDGLVRGWEYDADDPDYVRNIHYVFDMGELVRYVRFRDVLAGELRRARLDAREDGGALGSVG
jgi:hypothetical protein